MSTSESRAKAGPAQRTTREVSASTASSGSSADLTMANSAYPGSQPPAFGINRRARRRGGDRRRARGGTPHVAGRRDHAQGHRPAQAGRAPQGLWATHLGPELGGQGYGQLKPCLLNEILGRPGWAPVIFGCQAPDTGNAEIIAHYGTPRQKGRYLRPSSSCRGTSPAPTPSSHSSGCS